MEHAKTIMSQKSLRLLHDLIQSIGDEVSVANGQSLQRQCIWEEEARFKAVSDVMLHEAARLRTKVNGLASVNATLPNEILAYIFEFGALEDIEKRMHLPMFSRTVSHVCRLWRDVSLTSPALWTLFQPLLPPGVTSRAESLLDFVIQPRKTRAEYKPPGAPAFGQQLLRARSLRLTIGGNLYREDFQLMSSPAPHLTTLILRCHLGNNLSNLPGQLFAGHHPCLSEVAILRLAIPWSTFFPSNLRMLELVQISSEHQITMPKFIIRQQRQSPFSRFVLSIGSIFRISLRPEYYFVASLCLEQLVFESALPLVTHSRDLCVKERNTHPMALSLYSKPSRLRVAPSRWLEMDIYATGFSTTILARPITFQFFCLATSPRTCTS
ncbi:hypothetical protein BOTBODRAFT_418287 [Botryobasidium botryosum FD-172 SS1]|uniref:Uncharacterized protein n=1 Tax=Botryobasidium botryosum (strain FD-172 SS1) TaxID=930990 RepID=A0A067M8X6_BOTB1|nr:hypothetical protein BOTBODRAFT_418287 [Botryobasidium botryosum FD-172 SS1]